MRPRLAALALTLASLVLVAGAAHAADAGDDVEALLRSLRHDADALSTSDCNDACKALASMRRAADRICSLDDGPRCADARATLDDAAKKVRTACPECVIATRSPDKAPPRPVSPVSEGPGGGAATPQAAPAPEVQAERGRGGCASCRTSSGEADGTGGTCGAAWAVALAAWLALRGRRLRRR